MAVEQQNRSRSRGLHGGVRRSRIALFLIALFLSSSCTQLSRPEPEPFFAQSVPPKAQELRWSNGGLPKSFDPALASAPPETDVVRAVYEGLTDTDPTTLEEIPGVAASWEASEDLRVWTFRLRKDAKWSNGKPVTANDFVRAWQRLVKLGDKTAHRNLLSNIAGVPRSGPEAPVTTTDAAELLLGSNTNQAPIAPPVQRVGQPPSNVDTRSGVPAGNANVSSRPAATPESVPFGAVADGDHVLTVTLNLPDKEFPRLVANPIFRPIFNNGEEFIGKELNRNIVTNGPFQIESVNAGGIVLERSATYWNRDVVRLERVHLVAVESPEKALAAYRAGELDAVTNATFSPLVLKLLTPYQDFRKNRHSALNFYEVNSVKAPFSDRRVRAALSNALERERLTENETGGMTQPALGFLPYSSTSRTELTQDKERARELLEEAGYPDGEGFPVIRLVVNRNDTQQRVARSVARMWKQNLNLETEVIVKDAAELERARAAGDFDLVRRGVVFPTSDQTANFMAIFDSGPSAVGQSGPSQPGPSPTQSPDVDGNAATDGDTTAGTPAGSGPAAWTEDVALFELRAIPLYFPTSYSLVKPYVSGFETNSLDAITLTNVAIDSDWEPQPAG